MSKIEIIYLRPEEPETVYLNSEEPVLFEVLEENATTKIDLEPQVNVHIENKKENTKPKKKINKKTNHKKHKNLTRVFTLFFVMSVCFIFVFNLGYLPIKALMHTPEPIACRGELKIDQYMDQYPAMKSIPKLDNIKFNVYLSDASLKTVANNYKYKLEKDGYDLDYDGIVTKKGKTFHYYGFVKGLTAIGILISDDISKIFGYETVVLSSIGNIYDYKEIITWAKTNIDI